MSEGGGVPSAFFLFHGKVYLLLYCARKGDDDRGTCGSGGSCEHFFFFFSFFLPVHAPFCRSVEDKYFVRRKTFEKRPDKPKKRVKKKLRCLGA